MKNKKNQADNFTDYDILLITGNNEKWTKMLSNVFYFFIIFYYI